MKQHITPEQLQELTEEQKQRLREWWLKKDNEKRELWISGKADSFIRNEGEWYTDGEKEYIVVDHNKECCGGDYCDCEGNQPIINSCLPLLSIGQMIYLLGEEELSGNVVFYSIDRKNEVTESSWQFSCGEKLLQYDELCDALFEAVKAVL